MCKATWKETLIDPGYFFLRKHFLKSARPVWSLSVHTPSYNYIVTWRVPCSGVVLCFAYKTGEGAEQRSVRSVVYVQRSAAPSSGENNRLYRLQFVAKEVRRCFSWWAVLFTLNQKSRVVIYHLKYTPILIRHIYWTHLNCFLLFLLLSPLWFSQWLSQRLGAFPNDPLEKR